MNCHVVDFSSMNWVIIWLIICWKLSSHIMPYGVNGLLVVTPFLLISLTTNLTNDDGCTMNSKREVD